MTLADSVSKFNGPSIFAGTSYYYCYYYLILILFSILVALTKPYSLLSAAEESFATELVKFGCNK